MEEVGKPMQWGWSDCHLLPLRALDALEGGGRHAEPHLGEYTERTALRYQRRTWRWSLPEYLAAAGGEKVEDPTIGDIVLLSLRDWPTAGGGVMTPRELVMMARDGAVDLVPLHDVRAAGLYLDSWRFPCLSPS